MKLLAPSLLFCLASPILAQTAPPPDAATPIAPAYTLKAGTQLVIVDVAVHDKHGKPVHGLKQSDFSLSEGNKPQAVRNFEEHAALSPAQLADVPSHASLPPGEFTNFVATPQTGALNIILIDILNTAVSNQMYMRTELIEYLKHARPDSRTAIYALTTHLVQLQGFTSDPALLLAALDGRGKPKAAVYRDSLNGGLPDSQQNTIAGEFTAHNDDPRGGSEVDPVIAQIESPINAFQQEMRAYTTLDALNLLGRTLATFPGHKNLIWFSGDFPAQFFPSDTPADGVYATTASLDDEFRDTVNLLSRAQVAVYPIDAQGLRVDLANTVDKANGRYAAAHGQGGVASLADANAESALRNDEHFSMQQIAQDTGGTAFENSNDLTRGVTEAMDDGANYYTFAYTPSGDSTKEGFRHISVKLSDPAYKLSYRRGYYAGHSARISLAASSPAKAAASPLQQALLLASPTPTEILVRVRAVPLAGDPQPSVIAENMLNPNLKKKVEGPFRTYQVSTAASVRNMSFTHGADNIIHTNVDFVTNVYDPDGNLINVQANTIHADYKPEEMQTLLRSGLTFDQRISVPVKGEYFLRVAVHDHAGGHTGAVQIPIDSIAKLPPLAPPTKATPAPATK